MVSIDSWWYSRVRDRSQALLELVLNAISDDYESVEIIRESINEWGNDESLKSWPAMNAVPVSRQEIIKALEALTQHGYAQAFELSAQSPHAQAAEFREKEIDELWFYVTPQGLRAVRELCKQIEETP